MFAAIQELKVPAVIAVVLLTTLGYSWEQNFENKATVTSWPAKDPELMKRVMADFDDDALPNLPAVSNTSSDQVVSAAE